MKTAAQRPSAPRPPKVRQGGSAVPQRSAWGSLSPLVQHTICLAVLLAITAGFFAAITLGGKSLVGGDTVQWRGMAQSMLEYEERTGRQALWAPNAFGGMPGYMIDYPAPVPQLDSVLSWLRRLGAWPTAHFFALLLGGYCLIYYLVRDALGATLGAVAFGLTTYLPLILLAGHNSKFIALSLAPWLLLPGINPAWLRFVSHKLLRLLSPWLVRVAHRHGVPVVHTVHNYRQVCASGIYFRDGHVCHDCRGRRLHGVYMLAAAGLLLFAALVVLARFVPPMAGLLPVRVASAFAHMNLYAAQAFFTWVGNRRLHLW